MTIKKLLCITASIGMMMTVFPAVSVMAEQETRIETDHDTYIDLTTYTEYYKSDNTPVTDVDHLNNCVYYQTYYAQWIQEHSQENTEENVDSTQNPTTEESQEDTVEKTDENEEATTVEEKVEESKETSETAETKTEEKAQTEVQKTIENYEVNTWYHPSNLLDNGYTGEIKKAIKEENFVTNNWNKFKESKNPFTLGECTYFAWSRFYETYGFDSGARGNGKTNAAEIVKANPDKFELSSTPAAGATFSIEKNSLYPQYGHVGFVEAFDGTYLYISEGNVEINGTTGNIWIHKVKWSDYKKQYPDITFAVPKKKVKVALSLNLPIYSVEKFKTK